MLLYHSLTFEKQLMQTKLSILKIYNVICKYINIELNQTGKKLGTKIYSYNYIKQLICITSLIWNLKK